MKLRTTLVVLLSVLAVVTAACGGSELDTSDSSAVEDTAGSSAEAEVEPEAEPEAPVETTSDFPVTIESDGGTWTLESAPERIVSLSPTATEILYAIGAGDQVVAVDTYSYFPDVAPVTDLSGFDPNVEAVIAFDPDFVVLSNDANDLVASLTELDIPVLISSAPADIEGGYATMADLGVATGHVDETAVVIAVLRDEIAAAYAVAPETSIRVYHELGDSLYAASSFGFVGSVYAGMGAINIADEGDPDQSGFPQLTEEYIIAADPELIVITDQVGYTADELAARPGWSEITAVKNGNIVTVNTDIASRWGPRLPQFIEDVTQAVATIAVGS
jgi:iron complex transport system substrate-binding protein